MERIRHADRKILVLVVAILAAASAAIVRQPTAFAHHEQPPLVDGVSARCTDFSGFYFGSPEFASRCPCS